MVTSERLARAPIVAFGLTFAVVLALGQVLSPSPSAGDPAQPPSPAAPSPTSPAPDPSTAAESRTFDLGPVVWGMAAPDPGLSALRLQVWPGDGDQVHVCLQVPDGWRVSSPGWTPVVGGVHCRSATSDQGLQLTLERP